MRAEVEMGGATLNVEIIAADRRRAELDLPKWLRGQGSTAGALKDLAESIPETYLAFLCYAAAKRTGQTDVNFTGWWETADVTSVDAEEVDVAGLPDPTAPPNTGG